MGKHVPTLRKAVGDDDSFRYSNLFELKIVCTNLIPRIDRIKENCICTTES